MLNDRVTETQLYITCRIYTHILLQFIDNEEFMSLEELLSETRELEDSVPTPATTDSSSEKLSELRKSFIDYDNQVKELINKQDEVISLQQDIVSTGRLLGGLLSLSERNVITSEVDKAKQLFNLSLRENKGKDISDIFNPLLFQNLVSDVKSTCPTITNILEQLVLTHNTSRNVTKTESIKMKAAVHLLASLLDIRDQHCKNDIPILFGLLCICYGAGPALIRPLQRLGLSESFPVL